MARWNNCGSPVMAEQFNLLRAEVADLRTKLAAAVVDLGVSRAAHNAMATKLNADAGVTDADYAAQAALTATAPAAATTEAITRS